VGFAIELSPSIRVQRPPHLSAFIDATAQNVPFTDALIAQIVKMEDGPAETRVLIRPHSAYAAALGSMAGT